MCTYNRRFCLKQAIDSVLCQTYPDFEFVIVDDGSTDGTEELIKSYPTLQSCHPALQAHRYLSPL